MDRHVDVLIAGAGPGGSAAAIHFARRGLRVLVLDRATFPRDKPCAEYMGPVALRHFDALGVLPALDAAGGHPVAGTALYPASGAALVGRANQGPRGQINSSSLELSNVDIANEFVNMITSQRAYQANSKTITTADSLLGEVINMRR